MNIANIPIELRKKNQWVGWTRLSGRKVPMCPSTFKGAKSSDPTTWSDFSTAVASARQRNWSGVGFVFNKDYLGIDLDHCVENGVLNPFAEEVLGKCNSYTELSPSKTGIHIIAKGSIVKAMKTTEIEIYNTGRYFTVTGNVLKGRRLIKPVDVSSYYKDTVSESLVEKLEHMKPGNVDMTLTSIAGKLFRQGMNYNEVYSLLKEKANQAGHDDAALERICKSVSRYHIGRENSYGHLPMGSSQEEAERSEPIEVFTPATHGTEFIKNIKKPDTGDSGLFTGFPTLDRYTGGLKKGSIWVVGARTGVGKTSFSTAVANHLLSQGKKVLIFSTEMDWRDTLARFYSIGTGVSLHTITNEPGKLTDEDKGALETYERGFESRSLYIVQEPEPSLRVVSEEVARIRPDVFIFDHIQRVSNERDQRYLELAKFVKGLNTLCRNHECAGVVNSQLNRIADRETPALHHLKECGALEEEAHAVVLLSSLAQNEEGAVEIADLAKNRGPKGRVELRFDGTTAHFEETV